MIHDAVGTCSETGLGAALLVQLALAFALVALASPELAVAQTAESTLEQRVTIVGTFPSLSGLISDITWKANVSLLAYDAQDRAVTLDIRERPLVEAVRSILRSESYVLGLSPAPDGTARMRWIRVIGDSETARQRHSLVRSKTARQDLWLDPALMEAAFGSSDPAAQEQALRQIQKKIVTEPETRATFLRTDPAAIANLLRRYPRANEVLTGLRATQPDADLAAMLQAIAGFLR